MCCFLRLMIFRSRKWSNPHSPEPYKLKVLTKTGRVEPVRAHILVVQLELQNSPYIGPLTKVAELYWDHC